MTAALLLMTSTCLAGADAAPAVPATAAPAVVSGAGCGSGCGPTCGPVDCCDSCGKKPGLLDRIKSRMGGGKCHKHDDCCAPAPTTCCAPPPPPAPCNTCAPACDTCGKAARPNLLDRLRGKFGKKHGGCDDCTPVCDGCATGGCAVGGYPTPGTVVAPAAPTTLPPKDMPKPMEPKKTTGTGTELPPIAIPTPGAVVVPQTPVTPVSGPKLTGTTSPY